MKQTGKSPKLFRKTFSTDLRQKADVFEPKRERKGAPVSAKLKGNFAESATCLSAKLKLSTGQNLLITRPLCLREAAVAQLISGDFQHKSRCFNTLCRKTALVENGTFEG
ncbi:MAG: hypothetical protein IJV69_05540 [Kiritimatiellae bacterium]|nr:hypothetical protein [Kiritimatiellia bacterium]